VFSYKRFFVQRRDTKQIRRKHAMPIQPLTPAQLLKCAGKNPSSWRGDRMRNQTAVAFGAPDVAQHGFAMDAVAIMLVETLNERGLPKRFAATVVRGFFHKWIEAVSLVEHKGENIVFIIYKLESDSEDQWNVALGRIHGDTMGDLPPTWNRAVVVNIGDVMSRIRANAEAARINLTGTQFTPPPEHRVLKEWIAQHREALKRAMAEVEGLPERGKFKTGTKARQAFEAASCQIH
jgi:hypothetical protein